MSHHGTPTSESLSLKIWQLIQLFILLATLIVAMLGWFYPKAVLLFFWGMLIPVLPLLLWLAPSVWRNICPMATLTNMPTVHAFGLGFKIPTAMKRHVIFISVFLLFVFVIGRRIIFNVDGGALSLLILCLLGIAFIGGILFPGKSGWCGSFCPVAPVEHFYGQTPLVVFSDSHCQKCSSCLDNCPANHPHLKYLRDLSGRDPVIVKEVLLFAAAFPGFVLAYYNLPDFSTYSWMGTIQVILLLCLLIGLSLFCFFKVADVARFSFYQLCAIYTMIAINIYYWYALPILFDSLDQVFGFVITNGGLWFLRLLIFGYSYYWIKQTFTKEHEKTHTKKNSLPFSSQ